MRSRQDAEHAVALLALLDLVLAELPGCDVKIDGQRVEASQARSIAKKHVERLLCGPIGAA